MAPSNSSPAVAGVSIAAAAALAGFTFAVAAARSGWLPEELLPSSTRRGKRAPKIALGHGITPAVAVKAAVSDSDSDDEEGEEGTIDGAASLTTAPGSNGNGNGNGAPTSSPAAPRQILFDENDEVVKEQLTRNRQFFGARGQSQLAASLVVVVGLGGVGSHCAAALLRSGVGRLRLVDFDQVSLSSLNRHAVAERKDVGIPKATCLKVREERVWNVVWNTRGKRGREREKRKR